MKVLPSTIAGHYAKTQIVTASREKQIVMLHEKCVSLIRLALNPKTSSYAKKRTLLNGAQNILAQFESALGNDDITSKSLFYLYDYSYSLLESGSRNDCDNALQIMTILRDTFKKILIM